MCSKTRSKKLFPFPSGPRVPGGPAHSLPPSVFCSLEGIRALLCSVLRGPVLSDFVFSSPAVCALHYVSKCAPHLLSLVTPLGALACWCSFVTSESCQFSCGLAHPLLWLLLAEEFNLVLLVIRAQEEEEEDFSVSLRDHAVSLA